MIVIWDKVQNVYFGSSCTKPYRHDKEGWTATNPKVLVEHIADGTTKVLLPLYLPGYIITRSGAIILSDVIATLGGGRAERRMIERPRRRIKRHDDNSEYFWLWGWGASIRVRERTLRLGLRKESRDRKTNTNNGLNSKIDDCGASFWRMEIAIVSVFANYRPEEWFEWNIALLLFLAAKIKS